MLKSIIISFILVGTYFNSFAATSSGKYFDRAIFVLFENTNYANAIKQPYFKALADSGIHFTNFLAETHPSQGNYVALASGALNGVTGDGIYNLNVNHIADLLEARGLRWKVYAEDYPGKCFKGGSSNNYARKHNPFISFVNIQKNPTRCANIVNASQFEKDAARGALPEYVFYVPNGKNDGHDTGVAFADKWYNQKFSKYISDVKFMTNTIVITTFDENAGAKRNQIYTSIVGPAVQSKKVADQLNHYSLLKLIEENWNLGDLGKEDVTAKPILNIWQ
jgi:hypothetical protein